MFKPFFGACTYPGCTRTNAPIVVKIGWCDKCNYNHKQARKAKLPIKKPVHKQKTGEVEVFMEVWQESNQRCFVCDKPIPYPIASNFMHVLPKALNKYPLFKLYKKNIVLGCHDSEGSCHHRFDKEPRSSLNEPMWEKVFALESALKEEYIKFKSEINKKNQ